MKNLICFIFFLFSVVAHSQFVNGIPLTDLDKTYIRISATTKILKPFQVDLYLDYGQIERIKDINKGYIYEDNSSKKRYSFNGIMGALNYFSDLGYELEETYIDNSKGGNLEYNYILKKN